MTCHDSAPFWSQFAYLAGANDRNGTVMRAVCLSLAVHNDLPLRWEVKSHQNCSLLHVRQGRLQVLDCKCSNEREFDCQERALC